MWEFFCDVWNVFGPVVMWALATAFVILLTDFVGGKGGRGISGVDGEEESR